MPPGENYLDIFFNKKLKTFKKSKNLLKTAPNYHILTDGEPLLKEGAPLVAWGLCCQGTARLSAKSTCLATLIASIRVSGMVRSTSPAKAPLSPWMNCARATRSETSPARRRAFLKRTAYASTESEAWVQRKNADMYRYCASFGRNAECKP